MRIIEVNAAGMYGIGAYSKILNGLPEKRNFDIKDIARRGGVNIPYDGNPDKAWENEISGSDHSAARKNPAMGIETSSYRTWLSKCNSAKLLDVGAEPSKHFSNTWVLPDEESEQADSQEPESKTDIIVKPDGSRVLVMTMSIGGMETTMSLEISKPTKAPNDNSKQDADNKMSSAEAEMDIASDEMSNISTEA